MFLFELQFEIAALSDLHRMDQRLGMLLKKIPHLLRGFKIEFVGREPHPIALSEGLTRLNTQKSLMGWGMFSVKVMAIIRGHHPKRTLMGDFQKALIEELLVLNTVVLDLNEKTVPIKNPLILLRRLEGSLHFSPAGKDSDLSLHTAT